MEVETRKRERKEMEEKTEIRAAIEELSTIVVSTTTSDHDSYISTKTFLFLCSLLLQVLDKIGPTMSVIRRDIDQNIKRLEQITQSNPSLFADLIEILKKEISEGTAKKRTSCTCAFIWLTRSLDFMVALLELLVKDFGRNMEEAVEEAYNITLRPWHGWINSAAYRVALKLVPDSKTFTSLLEPEDENMEVLREEMKTLILLLVPILEQNHSILRFYGLDRLKCT